jgi:cytochrome c oxidase cbb3-type subunit 3
MDVQAVAADPAAQAMGERLFLSHCAQCHGSDAGGGRGYPSLRDRDWLYGGEPAMIKTSILDGRNGVMPPFGAVLGETGVANVVAYVRSLSNLPHDSLKAQLGKPLFATNCAACHGGDGKGNIALGAPNLTDGVWLYGSSLETISETIVKGRSGRMPAHREFLGEERAHILAAYVYGLSQPAKSDVMRVNTTK